jgi:hypothetical protein
VVDLTPYAACQHDADCVVQTTVGCGECSEDPTVFVAVSDPDGFLAAHPHDTSGLCVACPVDGGAQRRGPSWLHATCDTGIGACVLREDPH